MSAVPVTDNVRTSALPLNHRGEQTMSFSSLNSFGGYFGCQLAWAHRYVYHTPERPKGGALFAGTVFDAGARAGWDAKIETGANPDPDLLAEAVIDKAKRERDEGDYDLDADEADGIVNRGTSAARIYATQVIPHATPVATQKRVHVEFEEVPWVLTGYIDLVKTAGEGRVAIVDTKATMGSTKYDPAGDFQLGLYDLGATNDGLDVATVGFDVARLLKTKQEVVSSEVATSEQQRAVTRDVLGILAGSIEDSCATGSFLPSAFLARSPKCSAKYCQFFGSCDFGAKARVSIGIDGMAA